MRCITSNRGTIPVAARAAEIFWRKMVTRFESGIELQQRLEKWAD
jgi:hypothetical protein